MTTEEIIIQLLVGAGVSLELFGIVLVASIPLGLLLNELRKIPVVKWFVGGFINIMRGTPLMLQLVFMFYGLPKIPVIGEYINIEDRFIAAVITYILNYSPYFAEIFRGGFLAIPAGQYEAGKMLGMSNFQILKIITLPQVLKSTLPSIANEAVTLVKDTSLVFTLGVVELLSTAKSIVNETVNVLPYLFVGIIYFLICYVLTVFFRFCEKRLEYSN
jgi:polar amino acid transport system permease protein